MLIIGFRVNDIKHVRNFLNPIITITEHSEATSPDINFYKVFSINFFFNFIFRHFIYKYYVFVN